MKCEECFMNVDCACPVNGRIKGGYENCEITKEQFDKFIENVKKIRDIVLQK